VQAKAPQRVAFAAGQQGDSKKGTGSGKTKRAVLLKTNAVDKSSLSGSDPVDGRFGPSQTSGITRRFAPVSRGGAVVRQDGRPSDPLAQNGGRCHGRRERKSREAAMVGRLIQTAKSTYQYPLIFRQLWHTPGVQTPDEEIVYRDLKRFTYRQIRERIGRLASALSKAGVEPGDTVGVLEWDSQDECRQDQQAVR
jgi:non-ribosomal peptide synthetase component F